MQRLLVARPELRGKPAALWTAGPRGRTTVAVNAAADAAGIRVGMSAAEACALAPQTVLPEHRPDEDRAALEAGADELLRFSPSTAVEPPDTLIADITGCAALFGDEAGLLNRAATGRRRSGWTVFSAVADTLGAAWAVAHGGVGDVVVAPGESMRHLAALSPACLRLPPPTVERLAGVGIDTVARLAALPRAQLPARFGDEVLLRLDQALGRRPEAFAPRRPPPVREARREFEFPPVDRPALLAAVRELSTELTAALAGQEQGVRELECLFFREDGPPQTVGVSTVEPTRSVGRLMSLLTLRLESVRFNAPPVGLAVRALSTERLTHEQIDRLEADEQDRRRALAALLERLSAALGREAVSQVEPVEDYRPEGAYALRPAPAVDKSAVGPPAATELRPLRLSEPEPISVTAAFPEGPPAQFVREGRVRRIAHCAGPERIETGWWRGADVQRDYYLVQIEDGGWFWIFRHRHSGRWFLHGCFE
jgi:protein ImuB